MEHVCTTPLLTSSMHFGVHPQERGTFKAPGNGPVGPEVTLFISPLHVTRAGSDVRGPGAVDVEADGPGVADAAGSPGQVTGRGGRECARRGRCLTPHVGVADAGGGATSPRGRGQSTLWEAGIGRPHGKLEGRWRGETSAGGQGPAWWGRKMGGQLGAGPKSCAPRWGRGQNVARRARGRGQKVLPELEVGWPGSQGRIQRLT